MNDEVLGILLVDKHIAGALNGAISHCGRTVTLHLEPDGDDLALVLVFAQALVNSLGTIDQKGRERAARDLIASYNDSWREFQKANEDGTFVTVLNPKLTESEFIARLELVSLEVTGSDVCSLMYADGGMFAGHSILVESFDGEKFSDLHASLFG